MLKKIILLTVIICAVVSSLQAASIRCRSGLILSAEVTKANISIAKWEPLAFNNLPERKAFAVVSVKLDGMRNISIFDYSLELNNVPYQCVAIFRDNRFEYFTEEMNSADVMQMLFIIDDSAVSGKKIRAKLKSNLTEGYLYETEFFCTNIGNAAPTPANKIPAAGKLELIQ
jgi:hypothetical protein